MIILDVQTTYVFFAGSSGAELLSEPFQCCILPNFILDPATSKSAKVSKFNVTGFLHQLRNELLKLKFYEKNNDLYQFHQVMLY